jgi:hypothetical protein
VLVLPLHQLLTGTCLCTALSLRQCEQKHKPCHGLLSAYYIVACQPNIIRQSSWLWIAIIYMSSVERYSGWTRICVHAQPCMQGLGDAACLLCMLGAVIFIHVNSGWESAVHACRSKTAMREAGRAHSTLTCFTYLLTCAFQYKFIVFQVTSLYQHAGCIRVTCCGTPSPLSQQGNTINRIYFNFEVEPSCLSCSSSRPTC